MLTLWTRYGKIGRSWRTITEWRRVVMDMASKSSNKRRVWEITTEKTRNK